MYATVAREVPCYIGQFGGYYFMKKCIASTMGVESSDLGPAAQLLAGGFGGYMAWQISYP